MCYRSRESKFISYLEDLRGLHLKKIVSILIDDVVFILSLKKSAITLERTC
jgi:hypothetical protein